jgi:hypothetical protein
MKLMNVESSLCYVNFFHRHFHTFYYRLYDISIEHLICLCFDVVYAIQNHRLLLNQERRQIRETCLQSFCLVLLWERGHVVLQLVEALLYKPAGRRFDSG